MDRRQILKGLGWLAGMTAAGIPARIGVLDRMPVEQLQRTLGFLGYLPPENITEALTDRALIRFKRHARRPYRMTVHHKVDDAPTDRFAGEADPLITSHTVRELRCWIERGWTLPLGRFKFESLAEDGRPASQLLKWSLLREDAAKAWRSAMREADLRGATLAEPYGDTARPLGYDRKEGVSRTSLHICGRAVDVNQRLAQGRDQRYFLSPEEWNGRTYFRLFCRTSKQNGSQGAHVVYGKVRGWRAGARGEMYVPNGWYVDLTELLNTAGFRRIPAHANWEKWDIGSEWWHYQYDTDLQPTFLDECELIGISEKRLEKARYTVEEMDRRPA